MIARVRIWNQANGHGLIETADGRVHRVRRADVPYGDDLRRGQAIQFQPIFGPRGGITTAVQVLEDLHGRDALMGRPGPHQAPVKWRRRAAAPAHPQTEGSNAPCQPPPQARQPA